MFDASVAILLWPAWLVLFFTNIFAFAAGGGTAPPFYLLLVFVLAIVHAAYPFVSFFSFIPNSDEIKFQAKLVGIQFVAVVVSTVYVVGYAHFSRAG